MTDYKQLCAELVEDLESAAYDIGLINEERDSLIDRARAALAEPEPEGPTDEELDELAWNWYSKTGSTWYQIAAFRAFARAALARWGRSDGPAVPDGREPASVNAEPSDAIPADGEVAELANSLRHSGDALRVYGLHGGADDCQRAADLLEHQAPQPATDELTAIALQMLGTIEGMKLVIPEITDTIRKALEQNRPTPQPIPVERLPGPGDCDDQGRCWLLTVEDEYPQWRLHSIQGAQPGGAMIWVPVDSSPGVMVDCFYTSHWLPAHALPLPSKEVDGGKA